MVPIALIALSSLLMWASFPPLGIAPLAFVAPVPFFLAIRMVEKPSHAIIAGFVWGAGFFGLLLTWIIVLGFVAFFPLVVLMATFSAVYGFTVWTFRLWPAWRWWLIAVGSWVVMEWIRGRFPFGGFPWGDIGYPAASLPGASGSVQWIGPAGWTVLVVGVAAGLALVIESHKEWRLFVDPAVVTALFIVGGFLFAPAPGGQVWRTAIVQGSSPCPQVRCQNESQRIYESHLEMTRAIPAGSVEFVVWPENSTGTPFEPEENDAVRREIIEEARRLEAYILVSGTRIVGTDEFLNVNVLYSPDGVKVGEYWKRHPVPFGEYVPLRGLLDFIPQLDQVPRDMVKGTEAVVFPTEFGVVGSAISFEGSFARSMRSIAQAGAEIVSVSTNTSSYGISAASDQAIGMVKVNAAAIGLDTAYASITGKSTFISADGSNGRKTDLLERTILYGSLQFTGGGKTIWVRFGDWLAFLAMAGLVAAVALPGSRAKDESHFSMFGS